MKHNDIKLAANILFEHRLNKKGLKSLPKKLIPKNIEESYQIQNELKLLYLNLNNNFIIGKKVGCTNKNAQEQVNVSEPFYGNLFSKFTKISNCELKSVNFYKPFLECEISFIIKEDININNAPYKIKDVNKIFDKVFASIEIVDFRFGDNIKEVGINNLIISNGASEFYIQSDRYFEIDSIDLFDLEVSLIINNKLIEKGNTNLVLGNPLNSAIWLVNKLALKGEPMLKGQFITTGTCTKAVKLKKRSIIKADFGSLGSIDFKYI